MTDIKNNNNQNSSSKKGEAWDEIGNRFYNNIKH